MARVLLTGMSGSGKSTVLQELSRRGHTVVDLDDDGWSVEVDDPDGGREQVWRGDRVAQLLAADRDLVVSGCASNQGLFYDRFDAVVLLTAPPDVLFDRVRRRRANPFGRSEVDRMRIARDIAEVEPLLRRSATSVIDTRASVDGVADLVEAVVRRGGTPCHDGEQLPGPDGGRRDAGRDTGAGPRTAVRGGTEDTGR